MNVCSFSHFFKDRASGFRVVKVGPSLIDSAWFKSWYQPVIGGQVGTVELLALSLTELENAALRSETLDAQL